MAPADQATLRAIVLAVAFALSACASNDAPPPLQEYRAPGLAEQPRAEAKFDWRKANREQSARRKAKKAMVHAQRKTDYETVLDSLAAWDEEQKRARYAGNWTANLEVSKASGQVTCIVNSTSALTAFLIDHPTGARSRWVNASTADSLYPGSFVYLSVDGQRFSGREDEGLPLNADLLTALKRGREAWISWAPWPWGDQREEAVSLAGFAAAYKQCEMGMASAR
jgi:hypothetical protein